LISSFLQRLLFFFSFTDTSPTDIYTLSLHDALPILEENKDTTAAVSIAVFRGNDTIYETAYGYANIETKLKADDETVYEWGSVRSEEHTSELQSRFDLVCRLLLEKKKKDKIYEST